MLLDCKSERQEKQRAFFLFAFSSLFNLCLFLIRSIPPSSDNLATDMQVNAQIQRYLTDTASADLVHEGLHLHVALLLIVQQIEQLLPAAISKPTPQHTRSHGTTPYKLKPWQLWRRIHTLAAYICTDIVGKYLAFLHLGVQGSQVHLVDHGLGDLVQVHNTL